MGDAWIIDGVRSPRGRGKANGSLHHVHPQELLAQVLNALQRPGRVRSRRRRRRRRRQRQLGRRPGNVHRADGSARRGLAGGGAGHHAQPLLWLWSAGGDVRRDGHPGRSPGPRRRRRRGDDVALAGRRRRRRFHRRQPGAARTVPAGPAGRLGRPHRDARGIRPRGRRRLRAQQPAACRRRHRGGPVRPQRGADPQRGRIRRPRSRRVPTPRHDARRSGQADAVVRGDGHGSCSPASSASFDEMCRQAYPQVEAVEHVHHAGNSSGVVDGASALVLASPEFARAHGYAAAGADRDERRRRRRARDHAHGAWARVAQVPRAGGDEGRATSTSGRSTRRLPPCR